jgi:hypothetical protein
LLTHYQERDCILEGPLNNLQISLINLPKPKISSNDKRLTFTALGAVNPAGSGNGFDAFDTITGAALNNSSLYPALSNSATSAMIAGMGTMSNTAYYAKQWGDHPDIQSFDLRSQTSSMANTESIQPSVNGSRSGGRGGSRKERNNMASSSDSRYNPVYAKGDSVNPEKSDLLR